MIIFATLWFLYYTRLEKRIADPELRPCRASSERIRWRGPWASGPGIAFAMILLFGDAGRALFILLANLQTGIMIAPGPDENPAQSISAADATSLAALPISLATESIVLSFSVWLLFRTTKASVAGAAAEAH